MNRMAWMLSRKILFGCIFTLLSLATNAKDLALYLDYKAMCQGGDCSMFVGALNNYYASPLLDEQADALSRIKADYSKLNGWDIQSLSSIYYREKCGPANVVVGVLSYKPYPQKWWQQINFVHSCQSYRPDGKAPPSTSTVTNSAQIYGYCKSDSYAYKDYNTGECGRSPNECLKYPDNKAWGCGKTTENLLSVSKAPTDSTRVFHETQTCIAKKSCNLRCRMGNCKWMDKVIPDFVNPYLQKTGKWSEVERSCQEPPILPGDFGLRVRDRSCAEAMARNHIFNDLIPALTSSGCGSTLDWDTVFSTIEQCTADSFSKLQPLFDPLQSMESKGSAAIVRLYRTLARAKCLANRASQGLPSEINDSLKGKSCDQQ